MMVEIISFSDLEKIISEHLSNVMGIEHFDITYAKVEYDDEIEKKVWKVNVTYPADILFTTQSILKIDAETGDIIEFGKDKIWKF